MLRYLIAIIAAVATAILIAAPLSLQQAERQVTPRTTTTSATGATETNHYPKITLIYPKGGEVLSGTVTIRWNITDPDGDPVAVTVAVTDDPFPTCITCPPQEWYYIAVNTSNTGALRWDTSSVADGEYILMIEAYDGKDLSRVYSDWFVIKNS